MGQKTITDYEQWRGRLGWRVITAHYVLLLHEQKEYMSGDLWEWASNVLQEYRTRWER